MRFLDYEKTLRSCTLWLLHLQHLPLAYLENLQTYLGVDAGIVSSCCLRGIVFAITKAGFEVKAKVVLNASKAKQSGLTEGSLLAQNVCGKGFGRSRSFYYKK